MKPAVKETLNILTRDQEALRNEIETKVKENLDISDEFALFGFYLALIKNPDKVNWAALMAAIEAILSDSTKPEHRHITSQYLVEGLVNGASNKAFDFNLIKDHIGPETQKYIKDYNGMFGL